MVTVITALVMPMFWMSPRAMDTGHTSAMDTGHTAITAMVAMGRTTAGATATCATGPAEVTHPMATAMG